MSRDEALKQKPELERAREMEIERLHKFPTATFYPSRAPTGVRSGVLLADMIEYYCNNDKLLDPYDSSNLKAASYELRVGLKYSVGGKIHVLRQGDLLTIPRFEVAVIEILETINMPAFLIGRWNIRTKWAYSGLVWVGGPQVDAGYRGLLMCPIWNLSNEDFR